MTDTEKHKMTHWADKLMALGACSEAVVWARDYPDLETAWAACEQGDWMAWLVGRVAGGKVDSPERKKLLMALCAIVRLALPYARGPVPRQTVEIIEAYCRGEATLEDVQAAAASAYAAYAYAAASSSSALFVYATAASSSAATAATSAAASSASSSATASATAATASARRNAADIMRQHYPTPPEIEAAP